MTHKNNICKLLILLFICASFSACYVKRPKADISGADYNSRRKVNYPVYVKRQTPVGLAVKFSLTGLGGLGGYAVAPFKQQVGNEKKDLHALNIATGALLGAGIGTVIDLAMGREKSYPVDNIDKWIRTVNNNYKYLDGDQYGFMMIDPTIESKFQIRETDDIADFKKAFPQSNFESNIIKSARINLRRADLPAIISAFPNNPDINDVKKKYVLDSRGVGELMNANNMYPNLGLDIESLAYAQVDNRDEALIYYRYYPKSKNINKVFLKGWRTYNSSISDPQYILEFNNINQDTLNMVKLEYLSIGNTKEEIESAALEVRYTNKDKIAQLVSEKIDRISFEELEENYKKYGYVPGATEVLLSKIVIKDVDAYRIVELIPELPKTQKEMYMGIYYERMQYYYNQSGDDYREFDKFIRTYEGKPDANGLMEKARYYSEYNYCFSNNADVDRRSDFAKKYPEFYNQLEELTYDEAMTFRYKACHGYVNFFSKGKHITEMRSLYLELKRDRDAEKCFMCNGNGNCETCNARGDMPCDGCSGRGYVTVTSRSFLFGSSSEDVSCSVCKGTKTKVCPSCRANGRCSNCKGSGNKYK